MKKVNAVKSMMMLKEGKYFRKGHYSCGYVSLYWDEQRGLFIQKREDMGLDYFNPEISLSELSEEEMEKQLVEAYNFADFKKGTL